MCFKIENIILSKINSNPNSLVKKERLILFKMTKKFLFRFVTLLSNKILCNLTYFLFYYQLRKILGIAVT